MYKKENSLQVFYYNIMFSKAVEFQENYCMFVKKIFLMKKTLLFMLIITQIMIVSAQSIVVTGDTVFYAEPKDKITHYLAVKNISNATINVVCQKTNLVMPAGIPVWAGSNFCFGGTCYGLTYTQPSDIASLAAGQQTYVPDTSAYTGYYEADNVAGTAIVEYCFFDVNIPSDKTCVTITYNCGTTAIDDYEKIEMSDFYPNPANGLTHFTFNGTKAQLKIIDILGNEVKTIEFAEMGKQKIYLGDMTQGIYFGNLMVNDEVIAIKKLIVK